MGTNNDLANPDLQLAGLSPIEIDAIGEVLNISMGSAATAISTMLDKQVVITTPKVSVESLESIDCGTLEPAIIVKITYTEGISGSNVMVFRQRDMQLILNQLMGIDDPPSADFVFDELSMSAACEVMNQMMGSSATALSEFLGRTINISTPEAMIMNEENTFIDAVGLDAKEDIVSVLFSLNIAGVINSEFVSVLSCELARLIVSEFTGNDGEMTSREEVAAQQVAATQPAPPPMQQQAAPPMQQQAPPMQQQQQAPPMQQQQMPPMQQQGMPPMQQQQGVPPMPQMPPMQGYPQDPYGQQQPYYPYPPQMQGYPQYPYGYPPMPQYPGEIYPVNPDVTPANVKSVQFPDFKAGMVEGAPVMGNNMNLIMNVPLNVSIEIGKTRRKIKDIMNFTQGTVIELEKQAGAPVDIIVNGQLLAHGDVVVIDDNFGVRITEIVGTKELLNSLEEQIK